MVLNSVRRNKTSIARLAQAENSRIFKSGGLIQADCLGFQSSATSSGILHPRFEAAMRRFEIVATTACGVALGGLGWRSNLP
jgi:hypothetical protein